jgi:hypothetical protein
LSDQRINLTAVTLDDKGKKVLLSLLGGDTDSRCAQPLYDHALALGAKFLLIEEPYIDRDYSADFVAFYSSVFKTYPRHTKRLHLFQQDASGLFAENFVQQAAATSEEYGYLGFVVIRPIRQGPVGRTMLPFPEFGPKLIVRRAARSKVDAHLLATQFEAKGAPFIQQDRRIGACAQAAIWMASRPIHERHRQSSWHSISQITKFATTPTDADLSQSLPHGSSGLNPLHITRALRAMGHQPLCDIFEHVAGSKRGETAKDESAEPAEAADDLDQEKSIEVLLRYLDSGLPVILGLLPHEKEPDGHAITAVGYVEDPGSAIRPGSGYERFVRAILVHDDQRGPYRLLPVSADDIEHLPGDRLLRALDSKVLTVEDAVSHIFVPLSQRVFLIADYANIIAWDFLERQVNDLRAKLISDIDAEVPSAADTLRAFCDDFSAGRIIRRTYLTTAGRYRHHLARTSAPEDLKVKAIARTLPHFVYVTELIREDAIPDEDGARPIIGHLVFNATSSTDPNADLLFAHIPHLAFERNINAEAGCAEDPDQTITLVREHIAYAQRTRT